MSERPLRVEIRGKFLHAKYLLYKLIAHENWVYIVVVITWTQHGPVAGNERVSSWKIPDARLHTTKTETETETETVVGCLNPSLAEISYFDQQLLFLFISIYL